MYSSAVHLAFSLDIKKRSNLFYDMKSTPTWLYLECPSLIIANFINQLSFRQVNYQPVIHNKTLRVRKLYVNSEKDGPDNYLISQISTAVLPLALIIIAMAS